MAAAPSNQASPIVHAIGGSLGSALALLLFYPLERARIELQSQASTGIQSQLPKRPEQEEELLESVEVKIELPVDGVSSSLKEQSVDAVSSGSWSPVNKEKNTRVPETFTNSDEFSPSWDLGSTTSTNSTKEETDENALRNTSKTSNVLDCLVELHGKGALYQGVTPVITTIFASQFVFFFLHAYIKRAMQQFSISSISNKRRPSASTNAMYSLLSSCLAGIGNVLLTNPLWVANMAIVTGESKTKSLFQELISIYRSRGLKHLWSGTAASILLVSNPVIQFFSYEQLKHARLAYYGEKSIENNILPPIEAFVAGAVAKTIATIMTYPLQLTQTVLRLENNGYEGILDCLRKLYRRAGYKEWYTGMRVKLLQTVLTAAFTFLTYEQILGAVQMALIRSAGFPLVSP